MKYDPRIPRVPLSWMYWKAIGIGDINYDRESLLSVLVAAEVSVAPNSDGYVSAAQAYQDGQRTASAQSRYDGEFEP